MAKKRRLAAPYIGKITQKHKESMWDSAGDTTFWGPATEVALKETENRLGITIPAALNKQYAIQNGGPLHKGSVDAAPMKNGSQIWENVACERLDPIEKWRIPAPAEYLNHIAGLDRLVEIGNGDNAFLYLDYRAKGMRRVPGVAFIDFDVEPIETVSLCDSVIDFVSILVQSKQRPEKATTKEHLNSIWIGPVVRTSATEATIGKVEKRLGVIIPAALRKQLLIQNGGDIYAGEEDGVPMQNGFQEWMNAAVDGLESVNQWELASNDHWFDSCDDLEGKNRLVRIAAHSESQLCLDYRAKGPRRVPAVTYIDVAMTPTQEIPVCDSVNDFIKSLIKARTDSAQDR